MERRDFFICHASPDKRKYARPLERILATAGYSCWIDEGQVRAGDSIVDKLGKGIDTSRYIVPIITRRFLTSRPWAQRELRVALSTESWLGHDIVIPIYDIMLDTLWARFPFLREKLCISWKAGLANIMEGLREKLQSDRQIFESYMGGIEAVPVTSAIRVDRLEYGYGTQIVEVDSSQLLRLAKRTCLPPPAAAGAALKRHRVAHLFTHKKLQALWKAERIFVPRDITVVGQRSNKRDAVAAVTYSDIFYFQDVDHARGRKEFTLRCQIGRGGVADFVQPTGDLHEAHPAFKGYPIGSVGVFTVVEFRNDKPIGRTPYFMYIRKGIRYPTDQWQHPKTGRPLVNTRARDITNARFLFSSKQPNGTSTDIFTADFDGARMCNLSAKSFTAADSLFDRNGKLVGRWIGRNIVEFDSMRRGHHKIVRVKDCVRSKKRRAKSI